VNISQILRFAASQQRDISTLLYLAANIVQGRCGENATETKNNKHTTKPRLRRNKRLEAMKGTRK
jgi:hypothetical protein